MRLLCEQLSAILMQRASADKLERDCHSSSLQIVCLDLSHAQALQHPWLKGDSTQRSIGKQLQQSVVARIQRFGAKSALKRSVLQVRPPQWMANKLEAWQLLQGVPTCVWRQAGMQTLHWRSAHIYLVQSSPCAKKFSSNTSRLCNTGLSQHTAFTHSAAAQHPFVYPVPSQLQMMASELLSQPHLVPPCKASQLQMIVPSQLQMIASELLSQPHLVSPCKAPGPAHVIPGMGLWCCFEPKLNAYWAVRSLFWKACSSCKDAGWASLFDAASDLCQLTRETEEGHA